jgi:hypothetical protein
MLLSRIVLEASVTTEILRSLLAATHAVLRIQVLGCRARTGFFVMLNYIGHFS